MIVVKTGVHVLHGMRHEDPDGDSRPSTNAIIDDEGLYLLFGEVNYWSWAGVIRDGSDISHNGVFQGSPNSE